MALATEVMGEALSADGFSAFADTIIKKNYAHTIGGRKETWHEISERVATHVLGAVGASRELVGEVAELIEKRKFIPGGRYLAMAGRPFHMTQNCALFGAGDSREGWGDLMRRCTTTLMTGAGIGVEYSSIRPAGSFISGTYSTATGVVALAQMVNEAGRGAIQGGSRRAAIWAGLNWAHGDIPEFVVAKNWPEEVRALKAKDFSFPAKLDMTNISVGLDDEFFAGLSQSGSAATDVYWSSMRRMLKTGEPGFTVNLGRKAAHTKRNACVPAGTEVLTRGGYAPIEDLVGKSTAVWNGFEWSEVVPAVTGREQNLVNVSLSSGRSLVCTTNHEFVVVLDYFGNTEKVAAENLEPGMKMLKASFPVVETGEDVSWAYTQGFISADGMDDYDFFAVYEPKFCVLPRLSIKEHAKDLTGLNRITVRPTFVKAAKTFVPFGWSVKSRLDWLAGYLDGDGTVLNEGGIQAASVDRGFLLRLQKMLTTLGVDSKVVFGNSAGIRSLPDGKGGMAKYDCQETHRVCLGSQAVQRLVSLGLRCERLKLDFAPNRDASRFAVVVDVSPAGKADAVYCFTEPKRNLGCFEGIVTGQCCEIDSADDNDICNLGSINMARISSEDEMAKVVVLGTLFLLAGSVYSDLPIPEIGPVREKNRRLGLGLMGLHEWLLLHGKPYGPDAELARLLDIYATSGDAAARWADQLALSRPVATRAIAPNGSIAIAAETTGGGEPIFCAAYKRRYLTNGSTWSYQYVVDPTAARLVRSGVAVDRLEDAYTLAENVERRVAFQAWLQDYTDQCISSTINLPAWGTPHNNEDTVRPFGEMLLRYLPRLRGITTYPDGARDGQPLERVDFDYAATRVGEVFEESGNVCSLRGGSCGD